MLSNNDCDCGCGRHAVYAAEFKPNDESRSRLVSSPKLVSYLRDFQIYTDFPHLQRSLLVGCRYTSDLSRNSVTPGISVREMKESLSDTIWTGFSRVALCQFIRPVHSYWARTQPTLLVVAVVSYHCPVL
eukprot:SAG25_NODE_430_length_8134_cov_59.362290_3_plen_130_part_00